MSYQSRLENATGAENFKINDCSGLAESLGPEAKSQYDSIVERVKKPEAKFIHDSIVRNAFLIELVNKEITSTKFQVRWTDELPINDPRFASYEECVAIAEKLVSQISELSDEDLRLLCLFKTYKSVPYELPFDYKDRFATRLHSVANIELRFGAAAKRAIGLRAFLSDPKLNPDANAFKAILKDKIRVKTYLTDRAQTGAYQTNREKRWETHPKSVQYALRTACMEIETSLLLQVACFANANKELVNSLQNRGYLPQHFDIATCPITGEELDYGEFVRDVLHPSHGRSPFQVGHLNPLKTVSSGESYGHAASNISWISEDGNRIQGSLSMEEVDDLLIRTYINRDFAEKVAKYRAAR